MNARKIRKKLIKNKTAGGTNHQIVVRLDLPPFGNKVVNFKKYGQHKLIDKFLDSISYADGFNANVNQTMEYVYFDYVVKDHYIRESNQLVASLNQAVKAANKLNIKCKVTSRVGV